MNWNFTKPIFTSISTLAQASTAQSFAMSWKTPRNYYLSDNNESTKYNSFNIYRYVETTYPTISADGGLTNDPTHHSKKELYKLIKTTNSGDRTYTDTLNDLNLHGFTQVNGVWTDIIGNNILNDIFNAKRRIFYKIEGISNNISFNSLPFICLSHTNGVECKSTITQVRNNTLYYEGDTVWFNTSISNIERVAVDPVYTIGTNRKYNVWATSGVNKRVYLLNGETGALIRSYTPTITVNYISALRIDPDTGDAIVACDNKKMLRANVNNTTITDLGASKEIVSNTNNVGLTITKENNQHFAYVINNYDTISKVGLDTNVNINYPKTLFGETATTLNNLPNILGITNGSDNAVWVNGHVPLNYINSYTAIGYSTNPCGTINHPSEGYWQEYWEEDCRPLLFGGVVCRTKKHHRWIETKAAWSETVYCTNAYEYAASFNQNFLQDVGYLYGVTNGVNLSATNGRIDYSAGLYYPFTLSSNRAGYVGYTYSAGGDNFGRPYTTTSDIKSLPTLPLSQKGLTTTFTSGGLLVGSNYEIYQTNEQENKIHRLTWNGSTISYNYPTALLAPSGTDWWSVSAPVHCSVDSQNNIWTIQEGLGNDALTLLYKLETDTEFPSGGNSRYPSLPNNSETFFGRSSSYVYGSFENNPFIEFYLTREITFVSTATAQGLDGYGVCLSGNYFDQYQTAKTWCLNSNNYLTTGKRVYPNYTAKDTTTSFARVGGDTTEYNSDNTGSSYIFTEKTITTSSDIIQPETSNPTITLKILPFDSTPSNEDSTFWVDLIESNVTNTAVTGYDNFSVTLSTILDKGTFETNNIMYFYGDKSVDTDGSVNPTSETTTVTFKNYEYSDPSQNGKPDSRTNVVGGGVYESYVVYNYNANAYALSGDSITNSITSNLVSATVLERWPTAEFFVTPADTQAIRKFALSGWALTGSGSYPIGNNGQNTYSDNIIISGYDPLSAVFTDFSTSRSYGISSWYLTFGDKDTYLGLPISNDLLSAYVDYPHATSQEFNENDFVSLPDDSITERVLCSHLYKGPGTYYATLWVKASNSETDSWNVSSGTTNYSLMLSTFVVAASRRIDVLEICPTIEFMAISGQTVSSNYTNDQVVTAILNNIDVTNENLVSGYSPYVKLGFVGEITAKSLPIDSAIWGYNDYYSTTSVGDITNYVSPVCGWPYWGGNSVYTTSAEHTFIMPGFYNVTISTSTSTVNDFESNCGRGATKNLYVYVEEIYPSGYFTNSLSQTSGFTTTQLSGNSPLTIYVATENKLSSGSFPISRIDWDFGDGTSIESFSKIISTEYVNYYNLSTFADLSDPRNLVIPHTYTRTNITQNDTYLITMSAYACNTDSVFITSLSVGPIGLVNSSDNTNNDAYGSLHLLENRMFNTSDDLLLVFEGQNTLNSYSVLVSALNN